MKVTRSTISHTTPFVQEGEPFGGGLLGINGTVAASESTAFGSTNFGVAVMSGGEATVANTTIAGTTPGDAQSQLTGGLVTVNASALTVSGAIDAANTVPACSGVVTDDGYNLADDRSCAFTAAGSRSVADARLAGLADNAGPTQTVLPGSRSAARNAIPLGKAGCVTNAKDQRRLPRRDAVTGRCDMGSVEAKVTNPRLAVQITSTHGPHNGWYRGGVKLSYHCTLGTAPLTRACPDPTRLHTGGRHTVTKTVHALDGGSARIERLIRIDNVAPSIRVWMAAGQPHERCRDGLSGVARCQVALHRDGGTLTYSATARDKAGNVRHKNGTLGS